MQQGSPNSRQAHDIPEDIRTYVEEHPELHFDDFLWSPVVQEMLRLRMQMEKNGALPKKGAHDVDVSWRHWQE